MDEKVLYLPIFDIQGERAYFPDITEPGHNEDSVRMAGSIVGLAMGYPLIDVISLEVDEDGEPQYPPFLCGMWGTTHIHIIEGGPIYAQKRAEIDARKEAAVV